MVSPTAMLNGQHNLASKRFMYYIPVKPLNLFRSQLLLPPLSRDLRKLLRWTARLASFSDPHDALGHL